MLELLSQSSYLVFSAKVTAGTVISDGLFTQGTFTLGSPQCSCVYIGSVNNKTVSGVNSVKRGNIIISAVKPFKKMRLTN